MLRPPGRTGRSWPMRPRLGSSTLQSNFLTEPVLVDVAPPWASFEKQRESGQLQREEIDRRLSCLVETVAARGDSLPSAPWKTALLRWSVRCSHDDIRVLIDGFSASPFPDRGVLVAMLERVLRIESASRPANSSPPPDARGGRAADVADLPLPRSPPPLSKVAFDATPAATAPRTGRAVERERRSGRRSSSVPLRTPPISPPKARPPDERHNPPATTLRGAFRGRSTAADSRSARPRE